MSTTAYRARKNQNVFRHDRKTARARRDQPETLRRPDIAEQRQRLKTKHVVGWLMLVPSCLFTLITLADLLHSGLRGDLPESRAFRWFIGGAIGWLALFPLLRSFCMIAYIFGHEMTHILAARLSGAKVFDWSVSRNGGWVDTDRSNTFISLSPYFIPLYTLLTVLIFTAIGAFTDLQEPLALFGQPGWLMIHPLKTMYGLVGLTWAFHVTYTLYTLKDAQSDLLRNGEFFSVLLILLLNTMVAAAFLIIASPELTWQQAWECVTHTTENLAGGLWRNIAWLFTSVSQEVNAMPDSIQNWGHRAE